MSPTLASRIEKMLQSQGISLGVFSLVIFTNFLINIINSGRNKLTFVPKFIKAVIRYVLIDEEPPFLLEAVP